MIRSINTFRALALCAGLVPAAALAQDNNGGPASGAAPRDAAVGSLAVNGGRFLCTAAINSDGTIATTLAGSFIDPANTKRFATGQYGVAFKAPCGNVQIRNGWFRLVQRDTLENRSLPAGSCNVADLVGVPSGLFIRCFDRTGFPADTSFTVSVSR